MTTSKSLAIVVIHLARVCHSGREDFHKAAWQQEFAVILLTVLATSPPCEYNIKTAGSDVSACKVKVSQHEWHANDLGISRTQNPVSKTMCRM